MQLLEEYLGAWETKLITADLTSRICQPNAHNAPTRHMHSLWTAPTVSMEDMRKSEQLPDHN